MRYENKCECGRLKVTGAIACSHCYAAARDNTSRLSTGDRLAEPWKTRRAALCAEIARDHNYVWDAFDQGRLAFIEGVNVEDNPHRLPTPGYFHANMTQWELGWRREREFYLAGE